MAYKSRLASVLAVAAVAYPLLSLVVTAIGLFCVKAGFVENKGVFEKNVPLELSIYIKNRFLFPYVPIELVCVIPDRDSGLFSEKNICISVAPFGKSTIAVNCLHKYRGLYTAEIKKIMIFDPLRIVCLSKKVKSQMTTVFLPRKIPLDDLTVISSDDRSAAQTKLLTNEKEDFSHVTEYRVGDMIQLVHWKLTAKQDELMIKQYDELDDKRTLILCDYCFEESEASLLLRADSIIEAAVAFAMASVENGVRTKVDFGAADRSLVCEMSDMAGFDRFYELMAMLPAKADTADYCLLIDSYGKSLCDRNSFSTIILITGHLTDDVIFRAKRLAESFSGTVVLAYINIAGLPAEQGEGEKFVFLNVVGDVAETLAETVEDAV
jgi:uncharacterized protein (DUF58 family)